MRGFYQKRLQLWPARRCLLRANRVKCPSFFTPDASETRMIEANLTLLKIKDFQSRTDTLRGYL